MNHSSLFATVSFVGLLAVLSPGPDFLIVSQTSLRNSRAAGIATAFGIVAGLIFWIAGSIAGITALLAEMAYAAMLVKFIGAGYLIWLGSKGLRAKKQGPDADMGTVVPSSLWRSFRTGLLVNLTNVKCGFFFLSLFGIVISPDTPVMSKCACGFEIMLIAACWFCLVATIFSIPRVRNTYRSSGHWIDRFSGAILVSLGMKVALSKT